MAYLVGVLILVVVLLASIGLHELGHMVPAKKFGVRVGQYMIGFGPTVWSRTRGETEYGLKAIPLGGYVRLAGMYPPARAVGDPPADGGWAIRLAADAREASAEEIPAGEEERAFYRLSTPKKLVVMLGGPVMNLVIAAVLLAIAYVGIGIPAPTRRRYAKRSAAICAGAPVISRSWMRSNTRPDRRRPMTDAGKFRYIGRRRRAVEHRRFVAGMGRYAADIQLPDPLHVAIVASPHAHARIVSIDAAAALAMPGVHAVLTGQELCAHSDPMLPGVDAPQVRRYPLASDVARYAGEWVAAVVADSRALAEDAAEAVVVDYEPIDHVVDPAAAMESAAPQVHPLHGSNVIFRRVFNWGEVDKHFAQAPHQLSYRVHWARSATVPIETFAVSAWWNDATGILDVWASIQMPKYPDLLAKA
ncbi:MAG: site-2 protease family protein, partial [Cellulomonas sp.]|nr:site-2 protease family protein [Cellulomonas sp.]